MEMTWDQNMRRREVEALEKIAENIKDLQNQIVELECAIDRIGG